MVWLSAWRSPSPRILDFDLWQLLSHSNPVIRLVATFVTLEFCNSTRGNFCHTSPYSMSPTCTSTCMPPEFSIQLH